MAGAAQGLEVPPLPAQVQLCGPGSDAAEARLRGDTAALLLQQEQPWSWRPLNQASLSPGFRAEGRGAGARGGDSQDQVLSA